MSITTYDDVLPHLSERNHVVEQLIKETATKHAALDATVDAAAGLSPVPGTAAVVLAGQLYAQTRFLYPPMIEQISVVYNATPDDYTSRVARRATVQEGILNAFVFAAENGVLEDIGADIKNDLAAEFGQDFLMGLIQEALGESLGGLALAQVPWIGAPAGAAVAGLLAWKLTWRVGLAVSMYYQNGGEFPGGSRKATTALIKRDFVKGKRPVAMDGKVEGIRKTVPEVGRNISRHLQQEVKAAKAAGLTPAQIRSLLECKGYPADLIEAHVR